MKKLHPGAKWSFRIGMFLSLLPIAFVLMYFFSFILGIRSLLSSAKDSLVYSSNNLTPFSIYPYLIIFFVFLFIIVVISEIYSRLSYNNWAYEFTDHSLRIERGIIWKKYSNIPYERVQNVDIRRGVLARMLGFSTIDVQTAGASYVGGRNAISEGHIPAVDLKYAEEIRDFLIKKISKKSNSGL